MASNRVLSVGGCHLSAVQAKNAPDAAPSESGMAEAIEFALWSQRSSPFWIGDLLVRAEVLYGDAIYDHLDGWNWSIERIDLWTAVARKVPAAVRRRELSWSHHAAVASCPIVWQRSLLAEAVDLGLTSVELRKLVSARRAQWKSGVAPADAS